MPLDLGYTATMEKNKLSTDSVFLVALEIVIPGLEETVRVVNNTENIYWNGYTWTAIQFDMDEIRGNSAGEVPRVDIRVDNTQQALEYYLHQYETYCKVNYRESISCTIYVLNSLNLERQVTYSLNGDFEEGTTSPTGWETGAAGQWEETLAQAWVTGGIVGPKCVRVVQTTGRSNVYLRELQRIDFDPPYPTWHRIRYYRKGTNIANSGGTAKSRMRAWFGLPDDSTLYRDDPSASLPLGDSDWEYRDYSWDNTGAFKWIWPFHQVVWQTGTAYVDGIVVTVGGDQTPEAEYDFELLQPKVNSKWATFTLGSRNPFMRRYPLHRLVPVCKWKFKSSRCGYSGSETVCDKSFDRCKELANTSRFGGFFAQGRPAT